MVLIINYVPSLSPSFVVPALEGFIVAAFMPRVGRYIKAIGVKVLSAVATEIKKAEAKVVTDGSTYLSAVVKKV